VSAADGGGAAAVAVGGTSDAIGGAGACGAASHSAEPPKYSTNSARVYATPSLSKRRSTAAGEATAGVGAPRSLCISCGCCAGDADGNSCGDGGSGDGACSRGEWWWPLWCR